MSTCCSARQGAVGGVGHDSGNEHFAKGLREGERLWWGCRERRCQSNLSVAVVLTQTLKEAAPKGSFDVICGSQQLVEERLQMSRTRRNFNLSDSMGNGTLGEKSIRLHYRSNCCSCTDSNVNASVGSRMHCIRPTSSSCVLLHSIANITDNPTR
jgi:hypothetical protein